MFYFSNLNSNVNFKVERDTRFLERHKIVDYSLLIGIEKDHIQSSEECAKSNKLNLKQQPGWTSLSSTPILHVPRPASGGRVRPAHYSAPSHTEDEAERSSKLGEVRGPHVVEGGDTRWVVVEVF